MRERDSSGHMIGKSGAKQEYAKTDRYRFFEFHHENTCAMVFNFKYSWTDLSIKIRDTF